MLFLSFVDAVQMSAAGVWNVRPSLSLVCLCVGVSRRLPGPLDIDILCKSMAAKADIISLSVLLRIDAGLLSHKKELTH